MYFEEESVFLDCFRSWNPRRSGVFPPPSRPQLTTAASGRLGPCWKATSGREIPFLLRRREELSESRRSTTNCCLWAQGSVGRSGGPLTTCLTVCRERRGPSTAVAVAGCVWVLGVASELEMEGGVQLQEAPRALGESRGHDEEKEPLQSRADSPSAAQGLQFSSNTKKSDGSVPSRADSVLRLKQSRKSRLDPTRRMTTKKHDDLLTAIAVPRGYACVCASLRHSLLAPQLQAAPPAAVEGRRVCLQQLNGLRGRALDGCSAAAQVSSQRRRADWEMSLGAVVVCVLVASRYLDYWNARVDEAVCDFEETEELENAYKHQEQRLSPFRTSSTEWTINGAFGKLHMGSSAHMCMYICICIYMCTYM